MVSLRALNPLVSLEVEVAWSVLVMHCGLNSGQHANSGVPLEGFRIAFKAKLICNFSLPNDPCLTWPKDIEIFKGSQNE